MNKIGSALAAIMLFCFSCGSMTLAQEPKYHPENMSLPPQARSLVPSDGKPVLDIWHFPNGIVVTHVDLPRSDLEDLMDAFVWKFTFHFTKPKRSYNCTLEVREKGKPALFVGGFGVSQLIEKQISLYVGMMPLHPDLTNSAQIKWSGYGDGGSKGIIDNPFKGADGFSELIGTNWVEKGAIPLLLANKGKRELVLVLVVTP